MQSWLVVEGFSKVSRENNFHEPLIHVEQSIRVPYLPLLLHDLHPGRLLLNRRPKTESVNSFSLGEEVE